MIISSSCSHHRYGKFRHPLYLLWPIYLTSPPLASIFSFTGAGSISGYSAFRVTSRNESNRLAETSLRVTFLIPVSLCYLQKSPPPVTPEIRPSPFTPKISFTPITLKIPLPAYQPCPPLSPLKFPPPSVTPEIFSRGSNARPFTGGMLVPTKSE
jgi:hypothetical protein